jgi:hypothetical protein
LLSIDELLRRVGIELWGRVVFCNDEGKPVDADALVRRQFLAALRRAKIRQVRQHSIGMGIS